MAAACGATDRIQGYKGTRAHDILVFPPLHEAAPCTGEGRRGYRSDHYAEAAGDQWECNRPAVFRAWIAPLSGEQLVEERDGHDWLLP